jgi:hypothetical protein
MLIHNTTSFLLVSESSRNTSGAAEWQIWKKASRSGGIGKLSKTVLEKQETERNIVGTDYPEILEVVQKNLVRKSSQDTVCILKDLKTGKFTDSDNGFKKFLKLREDGVPEKECLFHPIL